MRRLPSSAFVAVTLLAMPAAVAQTDEALRKEQAKVLKAEVARAEATDAKCERMSALAAFPADADESTALGVAKALAQQLDTEDEQVIRFAVSLLWKLPDRDHAMQQVARHVKGLHKDLRRKPNPKPPDMRRAVAHAAMPAPKGTKKAKEQAREREKLEKDYTKFHDDLTKRRLAAGKIAMLARALPDEHDTRVDDALAKALPPLVTWTGTMSPDVVEHLCDSATRGHIGAVVELYTKQEAAKGIAFEIGAMIAERTHAAVFAPKGNDDENKARVAAAKKVMLGEHHTELAKSDDYWMSRIAARIERVATEHGLPTPPTHRSENDRAGFTHLTTEKSKKEWVAWWKAARKKLPE